MVAHSQRRTLHAEFDRWQLQTVVRPRLALIDWWGSTRGLAARRVTKRLLCAPPLARMVAPATAAVTVTAVATLALMVVGIPQFV